MPSGEAAQLEQCQAADERAAASPTAADATFTSGCACIGDHICGCSQALPTQAVTAHDSLQWNFLQTPDGTWLWQCIRLEAESENGLATLVSAMEDANRHGRIPGITQFGRIERLDDDRLDGVH
jgi:hypothetical protein